MFDLYFKFLVIFSCLGPGAVYAYKPVVLIHGVLSGADSMMTLQEEIELVI